MRETTITTDKNNFVFPPRKPRSDRGDVVFTSCSRCFPIDTQAIRNKILDLAMRGKLTEQLPEDGSAEELYRQIQKEKQALGKAGKIKKEKPLPEILEDDLPFEIPNNWRWGRLSDITSNLTLNDGDWVLSDDMDENGTVKLIQLGSIGDLQYRDKGFKHLTTQRFEMLNAKQIYPGYLLINRMVADKMLLCILPEIEGVLITAVDVCWVAPQKEYYDIKFLMYALASSGTQQKVKEVGYGVTRFRISKTNLVGVPFPFPPLAEQHRIVEKIEQTFSILDTIDALQTQYADNLTVLKTKLLEAAIQGKLTDQLPEDGTAEDLYRQIQAQKQALIQAGKIKKEKPLSEITADEIPFEIPANWKWVRIGSIGITVTGGTPSKAHPTYYGGSYPFFKPSDLDAGRHITKASEYLTEDGKNVSRQLQQGSILVCCIGSIGKAAIIDTTGTANQQITALTPLESDSDYLLYAIASGAFQHQLEQGSRATTVSIINKSKFDNCILPLPPLAEQKRIVAKLDEVLEMIGQTPPRALREKN